MILCRIDMKISDLVVKCLEAEGVKYVFGLPGEENEDLLFSLEQSKQIKFIATRHEQGAAFMANIFGRLTGDAGVCLSTLGPGATNLITGVADAHLDKSPVVAITGQGSSERLHKESHQNVDIVNMFRPITKWNASIQNPHITTEVVRKAFKLAEMEKPGATHFELPEDVAKMNCDLEPLEPTRLRRAAPDYKAIRQAIELIKNAKYPIIMAGNGAIRKMASKHLREFVERTNIPVVSTYMGKGAISDKDDHSLFTLGMQTRDFPNCAIDKADLVITIGYDIAEYAPEFWNPDRDNKIIHIDFLAAEVYSYYQPEVEIVADVSATLWELNKAVEEENIEFNHDWIKPLREEMIKDFESYDLEDGSFTVPGTLRLIRKLMNPGDILISDVGSHKVWIARNYPVYEPNSVIISNGMASMGIALPGGIAAKLAHPKRRVVTIMGDGGFLMNAQEIETAKRIGVGYTIIVFNDNDYGLISWKQKGHTGKSFGTGLTNPDFCMLAESFGIKGHSPRTVKELKENLEEAVSSNEMSLVEVKIDPKVNHELTEKLKSQKCEIVL